MVVIISSINTDYSQWIHTDVGSSLHIHNADVVFGKKKEEKKTNGIEEDGNGNRDEVQTLFTYELLGLFG